MRRFSTFTKAQSVFNDLITNPIYKNKCVGVAKNFFTNGKVQNKGNKEFFNGIPKYPYMFSKPLSCLKS